MNPIVSAASWRNCYIGVHRRSSAANSLPLLALFLLATLAGRAFGAAIPVETICHLPVLVTLTMMITTLVQVAR